VLFRPRFVNESPQRLNLWSRRQAKTGTRGVIRAEFVCVSSLALTNQPRSIPDPSASLMNCYNFYAVFILNKVQNFQLSFGLKRVAPRSTVGRLLGLALELLLGLVLHTKVTADLGSCGCSPSIVSCLPSQPSQLSRCGVFLPFPYRTRHLVPQKGVPSPLALLLLSLVTSGLLH
jgi:hypothetical protein